MTHEPEMLSTDRHRLLKEHLMSEIAEGATVPEPRRKLPWLVAVSVVAASAAVTVLAGPGGSGGRPASAPAAQPASVSAAPSPAASTSATPEPDPTDPAGWLARAAKAAASRPDPGAKAGQFTYWREIQDPENMPRHERSSWLSVDGKTDGLIKDPTMSGPGGAAGIRPAPLSTSMGDPTQPRQVGPSVASFSTPTYEFVAGLPTDPQQLVQQLLAVDRHKQVAGVPLTEKLKDQFAFGDVQMIFMNVGAPPAQSAALMEAAAKIPGTRVVADEVDAAGRHGVAVVGMNGTLRVSLIFDTRTGAFLGVREVLLKDLSPVGPDGLPPVGNPAPGSDNGKDYDYASAVLAAGIVDHAGDEPKS